MSNTFMGLKFREFVATSTDGGVLTLCSQTRTDALYTAAELLDTSIENITVHHVEEWE